MTAIISKEIRSFFNTMFGYAFLAIYLLIMGFYFYLYHLANFYSEFQYVLQSMTIFFFIFIPVLTTRALAEEAKNKTDQLLYTSPISVEKVVIGKYLGIFGVYAIAMVITMIYPLIISLYAQEGVMNFALAYYALLGFTLVGAAYIAIGVFVSSLTDSQVLSTVVIFVIVLLTTILNAFGNIIPSGNKESWLILMVLFLLLTWVVYTLVKNIFVTAFFGVVSEAVLAILYVVKPAVYDNTTAHIIKVASVAQPFENFASGDVNLSDIVYYLSVIFIFIFLTIQVVKKKRWN